MPHQAGTRGRYRAHPRRLENGADGVVDTTEVDRLLQELERNLEGARSSLRGITNASIMPRHPTDICVEQETLLARLKVCSRDAKTARPMFTEKVHYLCKMIPLCY